MVDAAWLGGPELATDVVIEIADGRIASISDEKSPFADAARLAGLALPGLVNGHSHAFHRLLRGRTHRQGGDFWVWRDQMYRVAGSLEPDSYEELATAVYSEMALAGITAVGEFHYLHHQSGGAPYSDPNEMGHAMVRAARRAGIRICLLDAGYFSAGFDDRPLTPVQTRFKDASAEAWLERVADLRSAYQGDDDVVIGLAPHSVRAVPESALVRLAESHPGGTPVHIHVSEQPGENRECLDATGLTPTALLARAGVLGPETTLVHCTHVTDDDVELIAGTGATVCYCATTERDLADGLGPAHSLRGQDVRLSIGTDSHAVIDMFEEARGIELHSRLTTGHRGIFSPVELLEAATVAGRASLGFDDGPLVTGGPADFVVVSLDSPRLAGIQDDHRLDAVVYSATAADVSDVFVAGRRVVTDGTHDGWERAETTLTELARLVEGQE